MKKPKIRTHYSREHSTECYRCSIKITWYDENDAVVISEKVFSKKTDVETKEKCLPLFIETLNKYLLYHKLTIDTFDIDDRMLKKHYEKKADDKFIF